MCTVLLPPGGYPIVVNKYVNIDIKCLYSKSPDITKDTVITVYYVLSNAVFLNFCEIAAR